MLPLCEFAYNDMIHASTCETPFFMNHGLHPISLPVLVFAPSSRADTGRSPDFPEGLDWIGKQQKALSFAKDSIRAALDNQIVYADRQRQDTAFKGRGDGAHSSGLLVNRDFSRSAMCKIGTVTKVAWPF